MLLPLYPFLPTIINPFSEIYKFLIKFFQNTKFKEMRKSLEFLKVLHKPIEVLVLLYHFSKMIFEISEEIKKVIQIFFHYV